MDKINVYTIAVEVEEGEPTTQQIASAVANGVPQLEGEVHVMSDMEISSKSKVEP